MIDIGTFNRDGLPCFRKRVKCRLNIRKEVKGVPVNPELLEYNGQIVQVGYGWYMCEGDESPEQYWGEIACVLDGLPFCVTNMDLDLINEMFERKPENLFNAGSFVFWLKILPYVILAFMGIASIIKVFS